MNNLPFAWTQLDEGYFVLSIRSHNIGFVKKVGNAWRISIPLDKNTSTIDYEEIIATEQEAKDKLEYIVSSLMNLVGSVIKEKGNSIDNETLKNEVIKKAER